MPSKQELISTIRQLASEMTSMIGHPENPFPENILDELTQNAFDVIEEERPALTNYQE